MWHNYRLIVNQVTCYQLVTRNLKRVFLKGNIYWLLDNIYEKVLQHSINTKWATMLLPLLLKCMHNIIYLLIFVSHIRLYKKNQGRR